MLQRADPTRFPMQLLPDKTPRTLWSGTSATVINEPGSCEWREWRIREWLLLLLRFAVTQEPSDRTAAIAMAHELDSVGVEWRWRPSAGAPWRPTAPRFFVRTSIEVCRAILETGGAQNNHPVLFAHAARIENPRLKQAFRAAAGLRMISPPP